MARQRVLVIEDDPATVRLLSKIFEPTEFEFFSRPTGAEAAQEADQGDFDVVLLDKNLPGQGGMEVLRELRRVRPDTQVLVMTAHPSMETCLEAMRLGAYDYLLKPFDDLRMVVEKTRKAAERAQVERERARLKAHVDRADRDISATVAQLAARAEATLITVVQSLERRDAMRRGHAERVGHIAEALARELGLGAEEIDIFGTAARLSDVGFVILPDHVLLKPGPLSAEERDLVKSHVTASEEAVSPLPRSPHLRPLVRHHHERYDGAGYPDGLVGETIPLGARIIGLADTYDALVTPRPYHPQKNHEEAVEELEAVAGAQLDPQMVEAFASIPGPP